MGNDYFLCFDKISYVQGERLDGCILCHIRENSEKVVDLTVYRDKYFIASVNLYPYNPGHLLLFPSRHLVDIREFNKEEEIRHAELQKEFLNILDEFYSPMGYNIGFNMGEAAGASIKHLHLHIIPRYAGETGISDLIAGKRVLVESPFDTKNKIEKLCSRIRFPS